jgi:hypothetical protein
MVHTVMKRSTYELDLVGRRGAVGRLIEAFVRDCMARGDSPGFLLFASPQSVTQAFEQKFVDDAPLLGKDAFDRRAGSIREHDPIAAHAKTTIALQWCLEWLDVASASTQISEGSS